MSQTVAIPHGLPVDRDAGPFNPPRAITRLRDARPVSPIVMPDGHQGWLVTGYDAVRQLMADTRFSSRLDLDLIPRTVRDPWHARRHRTVPADAGPVHRDGPAGPRPAAEAADQRVHRQTHEAARRAHRRDRRAATGSPGTADSASRPGQGVRAAGAVAGDLRTARRPVRRPGDLPGQLRPVPGQGPDARGEDGRPRRTEHLSRRPGHGQARRARRRHPVRPRQPARPHH